MPTNKSRVTWILFPEVIQALKEAAKHDQRSVSMQANYILRNWLKEHKYIEAYNYTENKFI